MKIAIISSLSVLSLWLFGISLFESYNVNEKQINIIQENIIQLESSEKQFNDTIALLKFNVLKTECDYLTLKIKTEKIKAHILEQQTLKIKQPHDTQSLSQRFSQNQH